MIYRILFFLIFVGALHADSKRLAPEAEPFEELNGKTGVFEIALHPKSRVIFHRTFRGQ